MEKRILFVIDNILSETICNIYFCALLSNLYSKINYDQNAISVINWIFREREREKKLEKINGPAHDKTYNKTCATTKEGLCNFDPPPPP